MTRLLPTAVLTALLLVSAPVGARAAVSITQQGVADDGTAVLRAQADDQAAIAWSVCPPGGVCAPAARGPVLPAGSQPAGTTFEASAGGQVARSTPWGGTVTAVSPPQAVGVPAVGGRLDLAAATWAGGWGDELSVRQLVLCTHALRDCRVLATQDSSVASSLRPRVILGRSARGRVVYAVERRWALRAPRPSLPVAYPRLRRSAVQAVTRFGPVLGNEAHLRRHALRVGPRRFALGDVSCPAVRCRLRVTVRFGDVVLRQDRAGRLGGPIVVTLQAPRPRAARVVVRLDGRRAARGRIRIGA